jgi:hypothetical protein
MSERTFASVNMIILGTKVKFIGQVPEWNNVLWVTIRAASILQVRDQYYGVTRESAAPSRSWVVRYDVLFHRTVRMVRKYSNELKCARWGISNLRGLKVYLLQAQSCWYTA